MAARNTMQIFFFKNYKAGILIRAETAGEVDMSNNEMSCPCPFAMLGMHMAADLSSCADLIDR